MARSAWRGLVLAGPWAAASTLERRPRHALRATRHALLLAVIACAPARQSTEPAQGPSPSVADSAFLDTLERRTFDWFWETTNPRNGLTPDRWPTRSFSSIAAVGFALTAYPIGVDRGWVSRDSAAARVLTTLQFFWRAPQGPDSVGVTGHNGFFYHFLDMETGVRYQDVELSTIDTTLLLGGVLLCQQFFDRPAPDEIAIRAFADSLYQRVNWQWIVRNPPLVNMGWRPERGFVRSDWRGYDESMILYVLALGSPTHPIDPSAWEQFTRTYRWGTFYGQEHVNFAPLFGHQYSHVWIDFRGIRDRYMREKGIDYFENSRRAVLAQRAYALDNPNGWQDYGADIWGLTASDGPVDTTIVLDGRERRFHTYWARGAAMGDVRDDGTLAPTAAGGSVVFAPEIAIAALRAMRARYGDDLFQRYGFLDAFNPSIRDPAFPLRAGRIVPGKGWFDDDHLGIDQGPIIAMIANYRNEFVWTLMKRSPYIVIGLCRAGFSGGWLEGRCE